MIVVKYLILLALSALFLYGITRPREGQGMIRRWLLTLLFWRHGEPPMTADCARRAAETDTYQTRPSWGRRLWSWLRSLTLVAVVAYAGGPGRARTCDLKFRKPSQVAGAHCLSLANGSTRRHLRQPGESAAGAGRRPLAPADSHMADTP